MTPSDITTTAVTRRCQALFDNDVPQGDTSSCLSFRGLYQSTSTRKTITDDLVRRPPIDCEVEQSANKARQQRPQESLAYRPIASIGKPYEQSKNSLTDEIPSDYTSRNTAQGDTTETAPNATSRNQARLGGRIAVCRSVPALLLSDHSKRRSPRGRIVHEV